MAKLKQTTRGLGYIRERKGRPGVYQIIVSYSPAPGDYRQDRTTVKGTEKQARKALIARRAEVQRKLAAGEFTRPAEVAALAPTFRDAAAEFLNGNEVSTLRPSSRRAYANAFNRVLPAWGDKRIDQITYNEVRAALVGINARASKATVTLTYGLLRRFFKIQARRYHFENPVETLKDFSLPPAAVAKRETGALEPAQVGQLLDACGDDDETRLWIAFQCATGVRPQEAGGLTWQCIDFSAQTARILYTVVDSPGCGRGRGVYGPTKTAGKGDNRATKPVHLGKTITRMLEARYLQTEAMAARVGMTIQPDWCVFFYDLAEPLVPRNAGSWLHRFNKVKRLAGLQGITPKWGRHSFVGTAGLEDGQSSVAVGSMLGHTSGRLVESVYGNHASDRSRARGAQIGDALLALPSLPAPRGD